MQPIIRAARRFVPMPGVNSGTLERNIFYLYAEIAWAAVLVGVFSFNGAFALRLGASKEALAWLTAAPALISAVLSVPSARFIQRRKRRVAWILSGLTIQRAMYGAVALIPWLVPDHVTASTWLVIWLILISLPTILHANGFQALLAELVPERRRAPVFARRYVILFAIMAVATPLAGLWLDRVPFPQNYQWLYFFGWLTSLGSNHYLNRIHMPPEQLKRTALDVQPGSGGHVPLRGPIGHMLINLFIYYFALLLPTPLFTLYYIDNLGASDGWLGLNAAAGSIGLIIGYTIWERILRRKPYRWVLRRAPIFVLLYPVLIALVPDLTLLLVFNLVFATVHPGVDLACLNTTLKLSTPDNCTMVMSWYTMIINGAMFVAPLIGVWIAGGIGIGGALLLTGALRLLAGILFAMKPVAEPEELAVSTPAV